MSAIDLRAEIVPLLQSERNESVLSTIRSLLKRDDHGKDFDITDDELAELEEIDRRRKAGLDTYVSLDEAMRMIRLAIGDRLPSKAF
ncbi:MAG TPA: hypothetical protein PLY76_09490 [Flavobacteriales bacterium]|nr:hypothetical protein [Flavobacteriales bacterium]HRP82120.1 hypothetical protein [Flavobacteriales bacterium]